MQTQGPLDSPQQQANDPWAPPNPVAPPPLENDPWAVLATPSAAPPPAPIPAADPWAPAPPTIQPVADPWGSPASVPAAIPQNDPWASGASSQPKDLDSDFDLLRSNPTTNTALPPSSNGDQFGSTPVMPTSNTGLGAFDMTGMNESLQPKKSNKPEDFLGENSSLVNLDSLVGPPKPAQLLPQAPNPFLGSVMSAGPTAPQQNPFQQHRQPAPTINQMRAEPMMAMPYGGSYGAGGGFSTDMGAAGMSGSTLPPPLIPMSGGSSQSHMQPQQANNPFLLWDRLVSTI